jgi:hypothetical protein
MLLWINGPFGGGKTQTAHELHRRLPNSVICDPEHIGFGLLRTLPRSLRRDFQDLVAWRQGVVEVLDLALRGHDGVVIAPMTVVRREYLDETVGRLREHGHVVHHFALLANRATVLRRLRERNVGHALHVMTGRADLRRESFAVARLDDCLERLADPAFAEHIRTDDISIAQVADRIAASSGLTLAPNTDGALRGRLRRAWVGAKHIRLD